MLSNCGYTVCEWRINRLLNGRLYTGPVHVLSPAEYKSSTYPPRKSQVTHLISHSFLTRLTEYIYQLFPTIHTHNKNHKNFLTNNLLLIYAEVV